MNAPEESRLPCWETLKEHAVKTEERQQSSPFCRARSNFSRVIKGEQTYGRGKSLASAVLWMPLTGVSHCSAEQRESLDSSFAMPTTWYQSPLPRVRSEKVNLQVHVQLRLSATLRASFQSRQPAPRSSKAQEVTPNTKEASASRAKLNISLCAHRISSTPENPWIISRSASGQCKNNQPWQQLPGTSSSLRLPGQPTTLSSTADMGTYLPSWRVLWNAWTAQDSKSVELNLPSETGSTHILPPHNWWSLHPQSHSGSWSFCRSWLMHLSQISTPFH